MAAVHCLGKRSSHMYEKFSPKKFMKLVKAVKPVLKLIKRKRRTNAVTPSTCNYDIVESFQNDVNESELYKLDFRFFEDSCEADENLKNEQLERRMRAENLLRSLEKSGWAPESDRDVCKRAAAYATGAQRAEAQTPTLAV